MARAAGLEGRRGSIALAIATFGLFYATLARSPQSGDGIELVRVAVAGGVPHPTGFPLQAWIDRAAVLLPAGTPAFRLALVNLVAHAAAVFAASEALRRLGVAFVGRAASTVAFALFPPVWALAVSPEVFSIANLVVALAFLQLAVLLTRERGGASRRDALILGAIVGAAAAQHPITIEAAPVFAASASLLLGDSRGRGGRLAIAAATACAIAVGGFASLPLLRGSAAWPDWGHLSSASGIVRHVLRREYGTFSLTGAETGPMLRAIEVFGADLLRYAPLTALAAAAGAAVFFRRAGARPFGLAAAGTAGFAIAVLVHARMRESLPAIGYLSKLDGPLVLALALLAGAGVDALHRTLRRRAARALVTVSIAGLAVAAFLSGRPYADASRDDTFDVLERALGAGLPADAVYLATNDVESFLGAATPAGRRFPIVSGLLPQRWYVSGVIPSVEPRLRPRLPRDDAPLPTTEAIAREALEHGSSVAATNPELVEVPGATATLSGLFYVAHSGPRPEIDVETVSGALALCPAARELPALPPEGHVFSRHFFHRFARAYEGAARDLEARGNVGAAAAALSAARALDTGSDPTAWQAACDALEADAAARSEGR